MKFHKLQIIIEPEENIKDGYYAYCPQLPGCYSNGSSIEEARQNIREAIELHLSAIKDTKAARKLFSSKPRSIYKEELVVAIP